eukprot:TRINITY_DN1152_c0_g1_i2.p1 TRINITY_DN1152_c0_g1~~TRINITY_DN1152_c0_g1_i2.p1  ORF type:complete len:204 (-),score=14.23 TRINITY_DN1152_c0_g1_i2:478-1089(-)
MCGDFEGVQEIVHMVRRYIIHRHGHRLIGDRFPFADLDAQTIELHAPAELDVSPFACEEHPRVLVAPTSAAMPASIFNCQGPASVKFLCAELEVVNDTTIAVAFLGRTYLLRSSFDDASIPLVTTESGVTMRVINGQSGDVSNKAVADELRNVFDSFVLHKGACVVRLGGCDVADETAVAQFIAELRKYAHLYVVEQPPPQRT